MASQLITQPAPGSPTPEAANQAEPPVAKIKSFPKVMEEFKAKHPKEPKGRQEKGCSIRSKTSWEGVLEVLDEAAAAYTTKSGIKGKIRRITQFIGDQADTAKRISSVIPEIDYSKPIIGALTFLLDAFKRTSDVRSEVKEGIETLKEKFSHIEDYLAMYSAKEKVVNSVMTLYITMLKAIEEVIGYYTRHIFIKGLDAVWSGENYEKALLECLEKISDDGKKLIHEADTAHKQVTNKVAEDVQTGIKKTDLVLKKTNSMKIMMKDMANGFRDMFEDHIHEMDARHEREKQLWQREYERLASEKAEWQERYLRAVTPEPKSIITIVTQKDLLDFLNLTGLEKADMEDIIHRRELLTSGGQDRTAQIMGSPLFRQWMITAASRELLIHANSDAQPVSPLSFFCAMLMQNLRNVDRFRSVAFFCGLHPYEDYGGGRTMIMSLLAQLLQQQSFDLSFIDHELAYIMDSGDIGAFCYVFGELVQQIRGPETVFCIIDGINFYERYEDLLQEMALVLRFLLDLTKCRTVFKILITSPSTTEDVRKAIEDEDYLALPEQATNTQEFSALRFERQWEEGLREEPCG
ncbi:hypothetical protein GGS26DRAFT_595168 [Hypomontagnella submonticulosa]|nr:hypothetical protein GGS26DRAFT_595168 [Hypomontagnella submonticulosa]